MLSLEGAGAGDSALGEYLSSECVTCHQLSGHAAGGIPPIVGIPEDYFIEALLAYKTGERNNEVMRTIAAGLTAEDMSALAAYFAGQGQKINDPGRIER
jgi:cytochrome c